MMKENVGTSASEAKAALTKLPSNTTATKLPTQPPPLIKHDIVAKVILYAKQFVKYYDFFVFFYECIFMWVYY